MPAAAEWLGGAHPEGAATGVHPASLSLFEKIAREEGDGSEVGSASLPAFLHGPRRISVRRLRDDVDRALLLADSDPEAFARTGGVPDLDAELACASDEEARLQTRADTTPPEGTSPRADAETSRAFFTAPRDGQPLVVYASGDVLLRAGPQRWSGERRSLPLEVRGRASTTRNSRGTL